MSAEVIALHKPDVLDQRLVCPVAAPLGFPKAKTGVLLVNLGTPDATDYWSMRRYLKEFLSDRRVIETPRLLWWPILNLIILSVRPVRQGQGLRLDLEQGTRREPAAHDHARADGKARRLDQRRRPRRRQCRP